MYNENFQIYKIKRIFILLLLKIFNSYLTTIFMQHSIFQLCLLRDIQAYMCQQTRVAISRRISETPTLKKPKRSEFLYKNSQHFFRARFNLSRPSSMLFFPWINSATTSFYIDTTPKHIHTYTIRYSFHRQGLQYETSISANPSSISRLVNSRKANTHTA